MYSPAITAEILGLSPPAKPPPKNTNILSGLLSMLPSPELFQAAGQFFPRVMELKNKKGIPKELVPKESALYDVLFGDESENEKSPKTTKMGCDVVFEIHII